MAARLAGAMAPSWISLTFFKLEEEVHRLNYCFRLSTMTLTQQESIAIVLMSGGQSTREIAATASRLHPERNNISPMTVSKLFDKCNATHTVVDVQE